MVTGPYIAFGIDTEEHSLLKTANGKPTKVSKVIQFAATLLGRLLQFQKD